MPQNDEIFFPPGGIMGELIRSYDWSSTPLGPMEQWPQTLLVNLSTILESPFPMLICWGRELTILYNDAYIKVLGDKHVSLGKCLLDVWPEAREVIEPLIEKAFAGESVLMENVPFTLLRHGYSEQTRFDFSFSPLRDGQGNVCGLLNNTFEITNREKELQEAHGILKGITTGTEDLIAAQDQEFRYIFFNEAYRREFKKLWGREIAIGTSMIEAMAPWHDEQKKARDLWQRALNGETFKIIMEFGPTGREKQTYELQFNPVVCENGRRIGAAHILRNITEQVRMQEELQFRAAELDAALESLAEGVVFYDTSHQILRMNTMARKILGFSEEEVRLTANERVKLFQVRKKEGSSPAREELVGWRALQGEVVINDEMLLKPKGEEEFATILTSAAPIKTPDGQVIGAIQSLNDISSLKKSEEALKQSEGLLRALFQNAPISIAVLDNDLRYIRLNPAAEELNGLSNDEALGKHVSEVVPKVAGKIIPRLRQVLATGEPEVVELSGELPGSPGESRHWISSRFPILVDDRSLGVAVMTHEITARKRAEEALFDLANNLEQRVLKRTSELEQANRAKDQFLANMSHEIRTPMAGVLGLTEILLHQELPANVQDDLAMIRSSAGSVMTLINDLFDLSRINQGKFDFHPEEFDLRSMVQDAIGPFEFQARSKDLDFTVSIDESVPSQILCDQNRLGQVIKNLLSNAIKFTEQGFVRVHVKAEKNDEDTLRLNFTVADSGLGIPKSKQKEVFSAFTQLDPSYSKKFAGMGLGLAICKSLVECMGGEISVDSTKGKGATFRFYVTCGIVTEELEPTAPSITLKDLPPMTILIAEDNAVNRLFLRRALVTAGHKVGEAEDGRHALAKLKDTHFDLVLMDIQMPEMDGLEAMQRIRSGKHGRADIPIIALTAYAMKGDREKFLENGMDGYVTKPVDFGELARTVAEVCGLEEGLT
jgi:PAS domain S-box-containing protein